MPRREVTARRCGRMIGPSSRSTWATIWRTTWRSSSGPSGARSPDRAHRAEADRTMQLGFIGLGRMGANMVRRLVRNGHEVHAYNRTVEKAHELADEEKAAGNAIAAADSVDALVASLAKPRAVWIMVPAGDATEAQIHELIEHLEPGDTIVDGGNTNFHDDVRRHAMLAEHGIHYVDAGVSGGIWGLQNGFCLMVGGEREVVAPLEPIFRTLAPLDGYLHTGGPGSGHYVKMIHNGIEYGLMQAYAEGFEILHASDYGLD